MSFPAWESCTDPDLMVPSLARWRSARKTRLLSCALIRHAPFDHDGRTIWDLLPGYSWFRNHAIGGRSLDCREIIEVAERRSDGYADDGEWALARELGRHPDWHAEADTFGYDPERHVGSHVRYAAAHAVLHTTLDDPSDLLPFVFSYRRYLPDRPVEVHPAHDGVVCDLARDLFGNPFRRPLLHRAWANDDVVALATTAYEGHAFDLMPILGDALESAGCFDSAILRHCRHEKSHARGCWVLDQILGKEWLPPLGS